MIKSIVVVVLALLQATITSAQKTSDPAKADTKTTPVMKAPVRTQPVKIKTAPVTETPPAATTNTQNANNFYLTSAKVIIYTGNDNKEAASQVQVQLILGPEGIGSAWELKEMAVNSATELTIRPYYDRGYYPEKLRLSNVEKSGAKLFIHYSPNFFLDAWKIEKVVLTLEFRDDKGNLHPVVGTKSIQFSNIAALLTDAKGSLSCEADQFLMPGKTSIAE